MRVYPKMFGLIFRLFVAFSLCFAIQPGYMAVADDKAPEKPPTTDTPPTDDGEKASVEDQPAADKSADETSSAEKPAGENQKNTKSTKKSTAKKAATKKRAETPRKSARKPTDENPQSQQPTGSQPRFSPNGLPIPGSGPRGGAVGQGVAGGMNRLNGGNAAAAGANGGAKPAAKGQTREQEGAPVNGPGPDPKMVAKVMEIQNKHTPDLLKQKGIAGTATGVDKAGNVVVTVYTTGADSPVIPKTLDGVPVQAALSGPFRFSDGFAGQPQFNPKLRAQRPVPIGISSINNENPACGGSVCATGTVGCRLKDQFGNVFGLSNNHVFADLNAGVIGDDIVQPGPADNNCVCSPSDVIGQLFAFKPIDFTFQPNAFDAAIIKTTTQLVSNRTLPDGYGVPRTTTVKNASLGMPVMKYGRTTGFTKGNIVAINAAIPVAGALFVNQIIIIGNGGTFGGPGDSGSLVVDENRFPVGLLFAGAGQITAINPIQPVLDYFGLQIDGDDAQDFIPPGKITEAVPDANKGTAIPLGS